MQGFSVPRSPQGRTRLTPPPPWFYAGNLLLIDYAADPQAVAAVLPPGLAPDPGDPGGCTAFFVDWQYGSTSGEELTDPVRSQYHEFLVLVNAVYEGTASWVLRPPDRRLPETRLGRDRPAHAGQDGAGPPETRPRAWAVPIVLLVVLYAVSFLSLPALEEPLHQRAVELGWIDE